MFARGSTSCYFSLPSTVHDGLSKKQTESFKTVIVKVIDDQPPRPPIQPIDFNETEKVNVEVGGVKKYPFNIF